jgi:hypothetical protein
MKKQSKKRGQKRKAQSNFLIPAILVGVGLYLLSKSKTTSGSGPNYGTGTDTPQPPVNGPAVYKQLHKVNFGLN